MASFNDQGAERRPIEDAKAAHDVQTNPAATARPEGVPMAPLISTNQPRGVDGRRAWELGDISLTELERRNAIMKQPQGIVIDKERKASHQARYKELRAGATPTMDESLELLDDYIGRIIDAPLVVKNIGEWAIRDTGDVVVILTFTSIRSSLAAIYDRSHRHHPLGSIGHVYWRERVVKVVPSSTEHRYQTLAEL